MKAGNSEIQRCCSTVLFESCLSWLKIKNADKQYKTMLRALAIVGDIITYLYSRFWSVTDILKPRTTDRCLIVNKNGYQKSSERCRYDVICKTATIKLRLAIKSIT